MVGCLLAAPAKSHAAPLPDPTAPCVAALAQHIHLSRKPLVWKIILLEHR